MCKNVKCIIDILISLVVVLLSTPLLLLIALLLTFVNGDNPFFTQTRLGSGGKPFELIKFETMNDVRDDTGEALDDAMRLSAVGSILRKLSIDELPQFFKVVKGTVSIIGPRPLLIEYLPLYSKEQQRRQGVQWKNLKE